MRRSSLQFCTMIGLLCCAVGVQTMHGAFAETGPGAETGESTDMDQKRIAAERARLAARNQPGSRIPYQSQRSLPGAPAAQQTVVRPPPVLALPLPSPSVITPCDQGGCFDADGRRFNGTPGGTYLDSTGKTCSRVGTTMQCF